MIFGYRFGYYVSYLALSVTCHLSSFADITGSHIEIRRHFLEESAHLICLPEKVTLSASSSFLNHQNFEAVLYADCHVRTEILVQCFRVMIN